MARLLDHSAPPPFRDALVHTKTGNLSDGWYQWISRMPATFHAIPSVLNLVTLEEQGAAIVTTDFSGMVLPAGVYRASYYAQISQAATVSSSLTVTIGWTTWGVAQTQAGTAITGNTTATHQSGSMILRSDAGTAVTYAAAYASVGATS